MMPMDAQIELRQPALLELFSQTIINKRLGHAYLFEGSRGTGKRDVARWLAKSLFCQAQTAGRPCQTCNNCRLGIWRCHGASGDGYDNRNQIQRRLHRPRG